uniref:Uncharacterized protein orf535 n=1 Tax=Cyanophora paradoxa TaxID=2762 RepID=E9P1G3_CYAPA|nr:hypothetical protein CYPAM_p47 [Cyanophora paradoxa]ADW79215.1 hypothetical protein [Cyanophora paradoxa]
MMQNILNSLSQKFVRIASDVLFTIIVEFKWCWETNPLFLVFIIYILFHLLIFLLYYLYPKLKRVFIRLFRMVKLFIKKLIFFYRKVKFYYNRAKFYSKKKNRAILKRDARNFYDRKSEQFLDWLPGFLYKVYIVCSIIVEIIIFIYLVMLPYGCYYCGQVFFEEWAKLSVYTMQMIYPWPFFKKTWEFIIWFLVEGAWGYIYELTIESSAEKYEWVAVVYDKMRKKIISWSLSISANKIWFCQVFYPAWKSVIDFTIGFLYISFYVWFMQKDYLKTGTGLKKKFIVWIDYLLEIGAQKSVRVSQRYVILPHFLPKLCYFMYFPYMFFYFFETFSEGLKTFKGTPYVYIPCEHIPQVNFYVAFFFQLLEFTIDYLFFCIWWFYLFSEVDNCQKLSKTWSPKYPHRKAIEKIWMNPLIAVMWNPEDERIWGTYRWPVHRRALKVFIDIRQVAKQMINGKRPLSLMIYVKLFYSFIRIFDLSPLYRILKKKKKSKIEQKQLSIKLNDSAKKRKNKYTRKQKRLYSKKHKKLRNTTPFS